MAASALACALLSGTATAQEVTGTLGSPEATTTLGGRRCRRPTPSSAGVIKEKASDSTPWWAPRTVPPKGAPNVLLIMTDDAGFGVRFVDGRAIFVLTKQGWKVSATAAGTKSGQTGILRLTTGPCGGARDAGWAATSAQRPNSRIMPWRKSPGTE